LILITPPLMPPARRFRHARFLLLPMVIFYAALPLYLMPRELR